MIVKTHPLLKERDPAHYERVTRNFESHSNALLVEDFPPIHSILSRVDAFLGDFSSIGYDFLQFKRPMFFFPHEKISPGRLHQCGLFVDPSEPIFPFIEKNLDTRFAQKQEDLYNYAFDSPQDIRGNVHNLLKTKKEGNYSAINPD
jgi:CDP-glycerol glycerophosphotransferase (TagB/SpsB family)